MGGLILPFESDVNVSQILQKINKKIDNTQDDSDDDDSVKHSKDSGGKKRKRKRGKVA